MSIICSTDKGWVISHYDYTKKIYTNVLSHSGLINLTYNKNLFKIITPLMKDQEVKNLIKDITEKEFVIANDIKRKRSKSTQFDHEIALVENCFLKLVKSVHDLDIFVKPPNKDDYLSNNKEAREAAELSRLQSGYKEGNYRGGNSSESPLLVKLDDKEFLIPPLCTFVCCDIKEIEEKLDGRTYDFILIDPPWKNKFVRRKNVKDKNQGYNMLTNADIEKIPISKLSNNNGLVGVWCTNAPSHIEAVKENFFKSWGLKYYATWYWVKVTQSGMPVCPFASQHGKKPYERIIFGGSCDRTLLIPKENMILVSVPSSVHSHKPPLSEVISEYLPEDPKCLELFARYLLPGWTSVGDQVLSLQSLPYFEYCNSNETPENVE